MGHNGRIQQFCISFTWQFKNDAVLRKVSEAVMINKKGKRHEQQKRMKSHHFATCGS